MKINKNLFIAVISVLTALVVFLSITSISLLRKSDEESVAAYNSIADDSSLIALDTLTTETTTTSASETTTGETTMSDETTTVTYETVPYAFHDPIYYEQESRMAEEKVVNESILAEQKSVYESESAVWAEKRTNAWSNYKALPVDDKVIDLYNTAVFTDGKHSYLEYVLNDGEMAVPTEMASAIPIGSKIYVRYVGKYFTVTAYDSHLSFSICSNSLMENYNKQNWTNDNAYALETFGKMYLYTGNDPDGDFEIVDQDTNVH